MTDTENPPRSNLAQWQEMQENDYFENHPVYAGLTDSYVGDTNTIKSFLPLTPSMRVVVIGCGYGRETAHIAREVAHVWGIDVSDRILNKAVDYLKSHGVENFTPVLAEEYGTVLPGDIDLVFSIVVMQHLTRDLVRDYFRRLPPKLKPGGAMLIQFLEHLGANPPRDAELKVHEPSVSWNVEEIAELATITGLEVVEIRSTPPGPKHRWNWAFMRRPAG